MNWFARALFAAVLACTSAHAQLGQPGLSGGQGTGGFTPFSGASPDLSFSTNQYYGCGPAITNCVTTVRACTNCSTTDLLPTSTSGQAYSIYGTNTPRLNSLGLLIEEARVNQLLSSVVPATQTTGSLATGVYTLWVNGAGSATMSSGTATGCGTGAATNGTPVNFTITVAGTCTVTVAGALNAFQLELGAWGTSLIITTSATGSRAADAISLTSTITNAPAMSYYASFSVARVSAALQLAVQARIDGSNNFFISAYNGSSDTTAESRSNGGGSASGTVALGLPVADTTYKTAMAFSLNSLRAAKDGVLGTPDTTADLPVGATFTIGIGATAVGTFQLNGYLKRVAFWPTTAISDTLLQSVTAP